MLNVIKAEGKQTLSVGNILIIRDYEPVDTRGKRPGIKSNIRGITCKAYLDNNISVIKQCVVGTYLFLITSAIILMLK